MAKGNPPISKQQYKHVWQTFSETKQEDLPAQPKLAILLSVTPYLQLTADIEERKDNSRSIPNYVLPSITSMKI